jgi:hypothetical protein
MGGRDVPKLKRERLKGVWFFHTSISVGGHRPSVGSSVDSIELGFFSLNGL